MAIHVRCRQDPGFSIDVASCIFQTIAPKKNGASINVVNVSDAAIKQHCALGKVYDHAHFGDRVYALIAFNIHFRRPVAGQRDNCRFLRLGQRKADHC